jgi:hypothetical protein
MGAISQYLTEIIGLLLNMQAGSTIRQMDPQEPIAVAKTGGFG